jgi:hypothetical protein
MKGGLALLRHSIRRTQTLVLAMGGLLTAFQLLFALAAGSLQEFDTFDRIMSLIPDFIRQLLGPSIITFLSFSGIVCLGYFHVAIVAALVGMAIAIATECAGEIEKGFLDLVLAHPLARHWVITRSILLLAGSVGLVVTAMVLGTRAGIYWLAAPETARDTFRIVPTLAMNLAVLLLCWGAIALVLAAISRRRSVAGSIAGLSAMACYVIDVISQVWQPLRPVARFSPFHYYNSLNLITGTADANRDMMILACVAAAGFLIAYLLFSRRDL